MGKKFIILLIVLSISLYFMADFLLIKAEELYNKHHIKKMETKNNNNIYSSIRFYDKPTAEWENIKNTYNFLTSTSFFLKFFSIISNFTLSLYFIKQQKK